MIKNYVFKSMLWGTISRVFDASSRFFTVPLLLSHYGEASFGILTFAISANAYVQFLDLGLNAGNVKHFSQFIAEKDYLRLNLVMRSSIGFYFILGIINVLLLIGLANTLDYFFSFSSDENELLKKLLYNLSAFSIVQWISSVSQQALVANHQIVITYQITLVKNIFSLAAVFISIYYYLDISIYFMILCFLNAFSSVACMRFSITHGNFGAYGISFAFVPLKPILSYSISVFFMGFFQYTAAQIRPLLIGVYGTNPSIQLSEYRIIEVFPVFISSLSGLLFSILLPSAAQAVQNENWHFLNKVAYNGTRMVSFMLCVLCMPILLVPEDLLDIYVGDKYSYLSPWLSLWIVVTLFALHNSPVSTVVLAKNNIGPLIITSAISCVLSVVVNLVLINIFGIGSSVISYLVYVLSQLTVHYIYIVPSVLRLSSLRVLRYFIEPVIISVIIFCLVSLFVKPYIYSVKIRLIMLPVIFVVLLVLVEVIYSKAFNARSIRVWAYGE